MRASLSLSKSARIGNIDKVNERCLTRYTRWKAVRISRLDAALFQLLPLHRLLCVMDEAALFKGAPRFRQHRIIPTPVPSHCLLAYDLVHRDRTRATYANADSGQRFPISVRVLM